MTNKSQRLDSFPIPEFIPLLTKTAPKTVCSAGVADGSF